VIASIMAVLSLHFECMNHPTAYLPGGESGLLIPSIGQACVW
jgi:hypothetical protein